MLTCIMLMTDRTFFSAYSPLSLQADPVWHRHVCHRRGIQLGVDGRTQRNWSRAWRVCHGRADPADAALRVGRFRSCSCGRRSLLAFFRRVWTTRYSARRDACRTPVSTTA